MSDCINTSSAEFSALKQRAGLTDFQLKVAVRAYLMEHPNKWPRLDEIPHANSEESLRKELKLDKNNATKIENILEATGTESLEEAVVQINNTNRDLTTEIFPLHNDAIVTIEHRPSMFEINKGDIRSYEEEIVLDKMEQDDMSFYKGSLEAPAIDSEGNLIISSTFDSMYNTSDPSISMSRSMDSAIRSSMSQMRALQNPYMEESEKAQIEENGYYLTQVDQSAVTNKTVDLDSSVKVIGDMKVPEGSYIVKRIYDRGNKTETTGTIRRKQTAQAYVGERDISSVNSPVFISNALNKLAKCYGILTIYKTTDELKREGILEAVPEGVYVAAFVLDGNIIVNSDVASVDAPVHELMHVLLGSIKYTQPDLYYNIVLTSTLLSNFDNIAKFYPHRSQSDVMEEVFVKEYAKYLSGIKNEFTNIDPEIHYQLNYEMSRALDTILNGDNSVNIVPDFFKYGASLRQLGKAVNSKNMEQKYIGYADSAYLARVLANTKSDLFKSKQLEEIC